MALLLEACPSFELTWATIEDDVAHLDGEAPGGRLFYLDAASFVRHAGELQLTGATDEFDRVFDLIERFVVDGDEYVSNLGVIGFLEGMQMETITKLGLDPEEAFRPWLRPVSEAWWNRLNRFWSGERNALQVTSDQIRAEAAAREPPGSRN